MNTDIARPKDRMIQIGKLNARYWAEGNQGSTVILIHGLGGFIENWWPNIMTLAQQHRVYAVDLPGCGLSDKPADGAYTIQYFVQFIRDFMDALGIEHANLAGHSLGGGIVLQFVLTYPRLVDRMVLMTSAGLGPEVGIQLRLVTLPILGEFLTKPSLKASRWHLEGIVYDKSLISDDLVQMDCKYTSLPGFQNGMLKALRSIGNFGGQKRSFYGPIAEKLPTISQPALVIMAREDPLIPIKQMEAARKIPNSQVKVLDRCGHYPQFEHRQEVDQVLLDFLCD